MTKSITAEGRAKASESLRSLAGGEQVPTWPTLAEAVMGTRQCVRRDVVGRLAELAAVTVTEEDHERQQQIIRDLERERDGALREARHRERTRLSIMQVLAVVTEMEHHVLGVEGAEDSPVARWAAMLREAVKCSPAIKEDAEAARWVREHGGIDELDRRLMPPGMEWPKVDGEKVCIGDYVQTKDGLDKLRQVRMCRKGFYLSTDGCDEWHRFGERVKRPKQGPVGADGVPITNGESVYEIGGDGTRLTVVRTPKSGEYQAIVVKFPDGNETTLDPPRLTHTKPETPDSWEQLEKDAKLKPFGYVSNVLGWDMRKSHSTSQALHAMTLDVVLRAKALAERGRGER